MRRDRIASVVTALALVLAAVGGGMAPVGTAQAQSLGGISNECYSLNGVSGGGPAQAFVSAAYQAITGVQNGCYYDAGSKSDYENITATDGYATSLGIKDSTESYLTTVENFQQNSRSVAYSKAKISVVRELENGTGASEMAFEANQTVEDYYARQQASILADYRAKYTQLRYLNQSASGSVGVDDAGQQLEQSYPLDAGYHLDNTVNATYTLANGTTETVPVAKAPGGTALEFGDGVALEPVFLAASPDDGPTELFRAGDYIKRLETASTQAEQVKSNMWQYAQGVESQYNAGELNATTLYQNDPTLLAQEAGTSFNSTGYYGFAAAQLASIGYSGDLNQSHVIEINGANYTGTLFFSGPDGTTFETGKSYDFGNYSGSFYLAASDTPTNQTGIVRLDDKGSSFTVVEATNTQTGESVNETVTQRYVYDSANATNLQQEIDRLEELREFYEEQNTGGAGIPLGTEDKAIIGIIAAVVLVLALRD